MSDEQQASVYRLGVEDELLRALTKSSWVQSLQEAFFLKEDERETGLSVAHHSTIQRCREMFNKTYGVASLLTGAVLGLGLAVIPDSQEHANIQGLPHKDDDPEKAEWFASQLAAKSTIVASGKVITQVAGGGA